MKRDGLITNCAFYVADLAGEHNLSGISPRSGQIASWRWRANITLGRYVYIYASEIASPLSAYKTQGFMAGHSVAYAFISQEHRAGPAIDRTSEEDSAMERYGTIAMHYIQLSAYNRSGDCASRGSTDIKRDNHVFTDWVRRT